MKAITLYQPWASLIATGAKKIETRSWPTKYRGPMAIHAAKAWNGELEGMLHLGVVLGGLAPLVGKPLDLTGTTYVTIREKDLTRGVIVATCNLIDCIPTGHMTQDQIQYERYLGDFTPGRYAWILEDVKPLADPIPVKGMQGLWDVEI